MADRSIPVYSDGYSIEYHRADDLYHCLKDGSALVKKSGGAASYKALGLAKKFLLSCGATETTPPKKSLLWTPPPAAAIAPLEEQLAVLPADAPRFVVVEKGYGAYHEQGYMVYDRQELGYVDVAHTYNGWNGVTRSREEAEREAAYRQENPPQKIEYDDFFDSLFSSPDVEHPEIPVAPMTPVKPADEVVFVTRKYVPGETIDDTGNIYLVTEPSWFLSDAEVADLEDQDVFGARAGWQTKARLHNAGHS